MSTVSRSKIIAEELIRTHIRQRIKTRLTQKVLKEQKIRNFVRRLLEAETGDEEPSTYTGINVLANLLEKIIPIIEDDYKMLTTSPEQRESFKNHIIHAIKNALQPIEATKQAENLPENYEFTLSKSSFREALKIDLDPQDDGEEAASVEGEFIDIESDDESDDFVEIEDQNETGRNFASTTFHKVEKQIVDAYDMLADDKDKELFYDYLITNMLLYFDKFEDELETQLPATTTPEYEKEKESLGNDSEEKEDTTNTEEDIFS
tara:strand:+ start:297 stop:1085 length:789 start_codon:yes stop_codon:yes gene_type:complete